MADWWQNDPIVQGDGNRWWVQDPVVGGTPVPAGDDTDVLSKVHTVSGGILEGIPVVGPMIRGGVERAAAATIAPFSDETYSQVLDRIQKGSEAEKAANPILDTASQVTGAVAGTVPMVMAAPAAFGAGGGGLLARTIASGASGAALGGADAAIRSGGDVRNTVIGIFAGAGTGAAGPAVGKALGAGWQAIRDSSAAKAAAKAAGLNRRALFTLGRAVRDDGLDAASVGSRMNELGPDAMLMDLGPNLQRQAGALAATPGRGQEIVRSAIANRQAQAGPRVTQALDRVLGKPVDTFDVSNNWIKLRAANAKPAYQAAYEAGDKAIWSPELERLSSSPAVQRAMRGAVTAWRDRAIADGFGAMNPGALVDRGGQLSFLNGKVPVFPNIQFWDYTKRILDDQVRAAYKAGQNQKGEALSSLARMLRTDLDRMVPEYSAAREAYAGPSAIIDALEEGQQVFSKDITPGQLRSMLSEMTKGEREAYIQGGRAKLASIMGTARNDALKARQLFDQGFNKEKLATLVGPKRADRMLKSLDAETTFTRTRDVVTGNSETAARSAAMKEIAGESGPQFGVREGYMSGGLLGGARSAGIRTVERAIEALSKASKEARNAGLADAITRKDYSDIVKAVAKAQGRKVNSKSVETIARALLVGGGTAAARP